MPTSLDQILPSLQSLGLWSYWIVALVTLLEAFVLTGLFVPGTLAVLAAGILAQQGVIDFFDMAWFVVLGSVLGAEASYHLGRLAARGMERRAARASTDPGTDPGADPGADAGTPASQSRHRDRAAALLTRFGGFAMVLGRFLGPVSGFVSFSAALSGMTRRRFWWWNLASAAAQALALLTAGYFFGDVLNVLGGAATRIAIFVLAMLAALALLWFLVSRIRRALPFVISLAGSIVRAVRENPDVVAWAGRHPRISRLLGRRLDPTRFHGLPATLLGGALVYFLVLFVGLALDVQLGGRIVAADQRLASLLYAFRDDRLVRFFTTMTALGDKKTVITLMTGLSVILWITRHRQVVAGLWAGAAGSAASVALLKTFFARPRPELGVFTETSFSFPSGHAAGSVASLAMMVYVLWRVGWLKAPSASLLAVTVVFLVGLSRIYLVEHYLSDVLAGYLVGAMWSIGAIWLIHWQSARAAAPTPANAPEPSRPSTAPAPTGTGQRAAVALLAVATLAGAVALVATYTKVRNPPPAAVAIEVVADIPGLFASGAAPAMSQTITGVAQAPISLVILADSDETLVQAMARAGWRRAQRPGAGNITRTAWAALTRSPEADAPVTPAFWNGAPNDLGFEKPTSEHGLRRRHHARIWKTRYRTPAGARIYVGTASLDDPLKWGLAGHIAPDIDAERDRLVADLVAAGALALRQRFAMIRPRISETPTGDAWFTDGQAALLAPPR